MFVLEMLLGLAREETERARDSKQVRFPWWLKVVGRDVSHLCLSQHLLVMSRERVCVLTRV